MEHEEPMTGTAAAIYVRISRDSEGTGLGVRRQRGDCEALASRLGWTVARVYEDNDVSATKGSTAASGAVKLRPAFQRLQRDVEAGQIRALVVWDVDRLTRTPRELEDVIDWADRHGVMLASVGGHIDLGTPQGRLTARIKGSVARHEVEQSSRRLRAKHRELATVGAHVGRRPFGWDFDRNRRLVINPEEAAIVRECVDRVLSGEALWTLCLDLSARGITTTTGGPWRTQVLRRMLLRWRNCGIRSHHGQSVGPGQWEAIIEREIHERVIAVLTDPIRRSNNRGTAPKYLLTSVAYCGECQRYVVGTAEFTYTLRNGKIRTYPRAYKCPHPGCMKVTRRMDDVDAVVTEVVLGVLQRDGVRMLGGDPVEAEHARSQIAALEAKLALAADQFADDAITGEQLRRITQRLRPQLGAQQARLAQAQPDTTLEDFVGPEVAQAWAEAAIDTRKQIIRLLGMRITINRVGPGNGRHFDPQSVRITWNTN